MKAIIAFGIGVFATLLIAGCESPEETAAKKLEENKQYAERKCQSSSLAFVWSKDVVKARLKAPSTADFPFADFNGEYLGNCTHRITSYVDAQNGFGAQIRTHYIAVMQYDKARDRWSPKSVMFNDSAVGTNLVGQLVVPDVEPANDDQKAPPHCSAPPKVGKTIELPGTPHRTVRLVEQTFVDNRAQSTIRQGFVLEKSDGLTDAEARDILMALFTTAKDTCRSYPLQNAIVFLFLGRDLAVGTNWVGRLMAPGMVPTIDIQQPLLPRTSQVAVERDAKCEEPGAGEHGKQSIKFGNEVDLPPVSKRKIIGTWNHELNCTISLEEVRGVVYQVTRCEDCSGGKTGTRLAKKPGNIFREPSSSHGDYFQILPNGDLGSFDHDGPIDTYPKHVGLWP